MANLANFHKPLVIATHVAIVLGIAYTVATAVLFFVFDPDDAPPVEQADSSTQVAAHQTIAIERLVALNLFGQAQLSRAAASRNTEHLQETLLSLELAGVFVANEVNASTAWISEKGKPAERFGIDDQLPGNARLAEIYQDRVVISRDGVRELIRFEHGTDIKRTPSPRAQQSTPPRAVNRPTGQRDIGLIPESSLSPRDMLARLRGELGRESNRLFQRLGIDGMPDGRGGYAIGALADRPELSQAGLQPGDRILSVNGRSVEDPRLSRMGFRDLVDQGAASLEIQRGERRFVVTIALN